MAPGMRPEIEGLTGIRVVYNPENKSVEADLSKAKPKKDSRRVEVSCTSNLKMLGVELRLYASDFGDKYPSARDLNALIKNNKINKSIIRCPGSEQPYVYVPGLRYGGPAKLTLAHCKFHKKNGELYRFVPMFLPVMGKYSCRNIRINKTLDSLMIFAIKSGK